MKARTWLTLGPLCGLLAVEARAQESPTQTGGVDDARSQRLEQLERALDSMQQSQRELKKRLEQLEQLNQEQETQLLQMQGEADAATGGEVVKQADEEDRLGEKDFRGGQRALQALNPELSVVADAIWLAILHEDGYTSEDDRSGFFFRMIGVHLQSDLDPFSFTKIAVGVTPDGVGLGEAYMTWTSLLPGLSLTIGKFRQEFGVVNRWHLPGLDQYDWPLAMREIFGPGGLNQVGLALDWLMPRLWAHANHLVLQVTNGQNDRVFAGKLFSIPAVLLRLKSYYDLSESTYFELGLTGMLGWNNARGRLGEQKELEDEPWRASWLWGADWTLSWEPLRRAKYRNLVLRGELYGARKELGDGAFQQAVGLYQSIQGKVTRRLELGGRFDWTLPFVEEESSDRHTLSGQPYITWWQSPWVRLRLHYAYTWSNVETAPRRHDHRLVLQATFAAGPHKHERY